MISMSKFLVLSMLYEVLLHKSVDMFINSNQTKVVFDLDFTKYDEVIFAWDTTISYSYDLAKMNYLLEYSLYHSY